MQVLFAGVHLILYGEPLQPRSFMQLTMFDVLLVTLCFRLA